MSRDGGAGAAVPGRKIKPSGSSSGLSTGVRQSQGRAAATSSGTKERSAPAKSIGRSRSSKIGTEALAAGGPAMRLLGATILFGGLRSTSSFKLTDDDFRLKFLIASFNCLAVKELSIWRTSSATAPWAEVFTRKRRVRVERAPRVKLDCTRTAPPTPGL